MNDDIHLQWEALRAEFEDAKKVYASTFAPVIRGFRGVYDGTDEEPSEKALHNFEKAWKKWQATFDSMREFVVENG